MTIQWAFAFIDRPAEGFEAASAFWSTVLKWTVSSRRGDHDEFATLLPPDGDAYLKLQAVGAGGGMHLDLAVSDVRAFVDRARGLGAQVTADHQGFLLVVPVGEQTDTPLSVVLNWTTALKR